MLTIRKINERLSVAPQIAVDDLTAIADAGYSAVICNRPDGESPDQPSTEDFAAEAKKAGLEFHHIPVSGHFPPTAVEAFGSAVDASQGPVLAWCLSGTRSACLWALAEAGRSDVTSVLNQAAEAGYDLSGLTPLLMEFAASKPS
jgi:sulfide:quinone oxidoreductase